MTYTATQRKKIVDMSYDARSLLHAHISELAKAGLEGTDEVPADPGMVLQAVCYACASVIGELSVTGVTEEYRDLFVQDFVLKAIIGGQVSAQARLEDIEQRMQAATDSVIKKASSRTDLH